MFKSQTLRGDANPLLDKVMDCLKLKSDAELARTLDIQPPVISKMRHHRLFVGPGLLIRIHEQTGMSIREMKELVLGPAALNQECPSPSNESDIRSPTSKG